MKKKLRVLVVVDLQNDFCEGGSLAIKDAESIIPKINAVIPNYDVVIATKDWHPIDHCSFKTKKNPNGNWPIHCVANSHGAQLHSEFAKDIRLKLDFIVHKGTNEQFDSYSAFFDNGGEPTEIFDFLYPLSKDYDFEFFVCGLAFDFCVYQTAIDCAKLGYKTTVLYDLCKSVNPKYDEQNKQSLINCNVIVE